MRINHNIASLNTYRQLTANTSATSKSLEKLSSGLRINRAGDDAAGLAISEKMRGQIRGLDQASTNAQDSISLIQTAEGALSETHSILQRMRELSVQAANDTNTTDDRAEIQKEVDQLTQEIDRIADTTEFNTKKLLNGGAGIEATTTNNVSVASGSKDVKAGGVLELSAIQTAKVAQVDIVSNSGALTIGNATSIAINGVSVSLAAGTTEENIAAAINEVTGQTGVTATYDSASLTLSLKSDGVGSNQSVSVTGLVGTATAAAGDTFSTHEFTVNAVGTATTTIKAAGAAIAGTAVTTTVGTDAELAINAATTGVDPTSYSARGNEVTIHGGDYDGLVLNVSKTAAGSDSTVTIQANNTLTLQIGANQNQEMNVSIGDMGAKALGVDAIDVTTQAHASASITTIDDAIKSVSSERAKLGAYQNRLEHTITNLGTSSENLTAAESRIRDVDMAKEMMSYTKNNILTQAATAMLAQANQQPQSVLQLLQ